MGIALLRSANLVCYVRIAGNCLRLRVSKESSDDLEGCACRDKMTRVRVSQIMNADGWTIPCQGSLFVFDLKCLSLTCGLAHLHPRPSQCHPRTTVCSGKQRPA